MKSRKLSMFLLCFLAATGMLYLEKLTGTEWANFTQWMFAAYAAGNVGEHFSNRSGGS